MVLKDRKFRCDQALLEIPVGEPMADVRRVLSAPDGTVLYLAEVTYRGDYIHLDMDLKP